LLLGRYGKDKIQKRAKLLSRQFNSKEPTFAYVDTSIDILEDETSFLNIGQFKEQKYM